MATVSGSQPSPEARDVLARCHIGAGEPVAMSQVTGMAQLASGSELTHFVPLTGREPELADTNPVWVVQIRADLQEPGGEIWVDPVCVATTTRAGYFATGPVRNAASGVEISPEKPVTPPDRALPPLQP